jgi:hypothetical protein
MKSSRLYDVIQSTQDQVGSVHLDFVMPDDETCLIQGKVINLYPGLMVNRYTQSTRERLTNMITFITLHSACFQFFFSSLRRPRGLVL